MRWLVASLTIVLAILCAGGRVSACPPTVRLGGDPTLIADLSPILASRGIATDGDCPASPVSLERRGKATIVSLVVGSDRVDSREVTDVRTAATVIESWVRTDLEAPLLVHRSVADEEAPDRIIAAPPLPPPTHQNQLFVLGETSLASDHTSALGFQLGGCVLVGHTCLGARFRFANVQEGPHEWSTEMDREAVDGLADVDVPMHVGRFRLAGGAGFGLGWSRTHEDIRPLDSQQTLGLRLEPHASVSCSLSRNFALESTISLTLGQTVHVSTATEGLPADPRFIARAALGLRFEGP